jgi:endoglucanase
MKMNKIISFITASIMTICMVTSSNIQVATADANTNGTSVDKYTMRDDMTTAQIVKDMGLGSNLGNTFDAYGGEWIKSKSVKDYETAWGAPVTTKAMIDGLHNSGFNSLRIPVAWSNLMAADYTISPQLFDRVEEVMNYALDDNMYVVINIHWDGGWTQKFSTDYDGTMKRYKSIWTQISTRFAKYGDHLIFESQNEEGNYPDIWDPYKSDTSGKPKAYQILNSVNQAFVDLIRNSGGNNAKRHLLIAGYATDIDKTCDPLYKMPNDPQNRCAVSVHYYTPYTFVMMTKDADWGKMQTTWGSDKDRKQLADDMNKLKTTFVDKGIPVIIGEYAMCADRTAEMARLWTTSVCKAAYDLGICPMLWDTGGYYDRTTCKFKDPELLKQMDAIAGVTNTNDTTTNNTNDTTTTTTTTTTTRALGWVREGTNWTYISQDGSKATGWLNDGGNWYYLSSNGIMLKGWIQKDGDWYYLDDSGAMLANTTIDSYTLGSDGRMI